MSIENTTVIACPSSLSVDDLVEEYEKLSEAYVKLKGNVDNLDQEVFQLKRNLELSIKREGYLNQELESVAESHEREIADLKEKHHNETEEARSRILFVKESNAALEIEVERLKGEIAIQADTKKVNPKNANKNCECSTQNSIVVSKSRMEYLEKTEQAHDNLIQEFEKLNDELMGSMKTIAKYEIDIANLKDCYECAQENLNAKNEELENNRQIVDSMQQKIAELTCELAAYKSGDSEHNKKGNSLFAEVDDQRQIMKEKLAYQKQQYLRMKKEHQDSQLIIRRLKRENADMHMEIKACASKFINADKYHKSKLCERIHVLTQENEELQKKLNLYETRLVSLAENHKIMWLDSMLDYCKNETEKLKQQLYVCRLQKCEAEDGLVRAEESEAKWRFEALKSRCVIIDREMLLEKHNIPFEPFRNARFVVEQRFRNPSKETADISSELPLLANSLNDTTIPTEKAGIEDAKPTTDSMQFVSTRRKAERIDDIPCETPAENLAQELQSVGFEDSVSLNKENDLNLTLNATINSDSAFAFNETHYRNISDLSQRAKDLHKFSGNCTKKDLKANVNQKPLVSQTVPQKPNKPTFIREVKTVILKPKNVSDSPSK